jgi:hypothetical protein
MRQLLPLVFLLTLTSSIVLYHYNTIDTNKKREKIKELSYKLKFISISTQFKSVEFKEFVYE